MDERQLGVLLGDADGIDVLLGSTEGVLVGAADGASVSPSLVGAAVVGNADGADDGVDDGGGGVYGAPGLGTQYPPCVGSETGQHINH